MTPIADTWLFQGLPPATLERIQGIVELVEYGSSDSIFQEGDPAAHFYAVAEGEVELVYVIHSRSPVNMEIAHLKPGDVFGWSALARNDTFTGNARAVSPSRVHRVSAARLFEIMDSDPRAGYAIMSRLSQLISKRMHDVRTEIRWFLSSL